MRRDLYASTLTALFLLPLSFLFGELSVAASDAPNIILVMADDQGWGDTGYNGHPFVQTPALDAMAQDGLVFDRFYAAAPVCSPTRASVMTGRNPIRAKVPNHGRYMRPHEQTIGETLQAAGYVTGIFGKVHLGSGQPDSPCNPSGMGFDQWVIGLNFFDNDPYLSRNGKIEHFRGKGSVILMDEALAFLREHQEGEQPIFTVIWFPSPHDPHAEVPAGPSLYDGKPNAGYYREITLLDQQVGRLRRELREMGIADNTILWYCSDNGGLVRATSGGRKRKGSIYEGGLRVPGIVEWPARQLKGRTAVPVCTFDIYPTLMAMAGVELQAPHPLDGIDASGIIDGTVQQRSKPMGFWHHFQGGQGTWSDRIQKAIMEKQIEKAPRPHDPARMRKDVDEFPQFPEETANGHAAWNDWPWKLHRINGKKFELYNLADDPMESKDLSGNPQHRQRMERMQRELDAWMRSVVRSINGKDYANQAATAPVATNKLSPVKHLIDTHIHLYDTRRDIEMSWPPKDDKVLYKPHLPAEYTRLARAAGVTGVVIVEASDHLQDNRWVLDLVKEDDFYIGLVGNIDVYRRDFEEQLVRLKKDRRFVGVRPRGPKPIDFTDKTVLTNLRTLAKHNLTMDYLTNGGGIAGIQTIDSVARAIPELQIVVNHCLGYDFDGNPPSREWVAAVEKLAKNKNVFCKISGLYQRSIPQPAPQDLEHYKTVLDVLWDNFGESRLIYGSNWPVTKRTGTYASYLQLVDRFISQHGQDAREHYYWKNAATAYRLPLK